MDLEDCERWKGVLGLENYYEVSDKGRIRSVARRDRRGQLRKSKILKPNGRYLGASCSIYGGRPFRLVVHTEVMKAFVGERPEGMVVNHINGNKHDNRLSNLEYTTPKGNNEHALREGLTSNNIVVRITNVETGMISYHLSMRKASSFLGRSASYVSSLLRGSATNTKLIIEEVEYDCTLCYL